MRLKVRVGRLFNKAEIMRKRRFLLPVIAGLIILVIFSIPALADEVKTKDGRVFKGIIKSGIPELISIDVEGVISTFRKEMIREIRFEAKDIDVIETIEGDVFRGSITTEMPDHVTIKTDLGVVVIKKENIARITLERVELIGSPWDYFWLEGLVGTLGAAGGGIVGGLFGSVLCFSGDSALCIVGIGGGFVIGTLAVPIIAISAVGRVVRASSLAGMGVQPWPTLRLKVMEITFRAPRDHFSASCLTEAEVL